MVWRTRGWLALAAGLGVLGSAGAAYAAACCNVPTSHQVRVPGVVVGSSRCSSNCGGGGGCTTCNSGCDTGCNTGCNTSESCGGGRDRWRGRGGGGGGGNATIQITGSLLAAVQGQQTSNITGAFSSGSSAFGLGGALNGSSFMGGGGGSSFYVDYNTGYIPNLYVEEAAAAATASVSVPYQATRSGFRMVAIQAVCIDDKAIPHPASQVTPDKEIAEAYDGEIYRCLAGTRMQYVVAEYLGQVNFNQGQSTTCDKNSALYHVAGGRVECRAQKAARDCNERSLLRRYGAGIKILKMAWTETYTAYRTETQTVTAQASAQANAMGMAIDGGVGGVAH